jgi:hypothetical protein
MQEAIGSFLPDDWSRSQRNPGNGDEGGEHMTVLEIMAWSLIAATVAWGLAMSRAAAAISRLRRDMQDEVRHWQDDAAVARAQAAMMASEMASWAAGCKQGREDMMSVVPLLVSAHEQLAGSSHAAADADCQH